MRRLVALLLLIAATLPAAAQKPWAEYDERQQQQILSSRRVSPAVREAYYNLSTLDSATLNAAWRTVSTPQRERRVASLHLCMYERMRAKDGSTAAEDIAMLAAYPEYMLQRMEHEEHHYDLYSYAFAFGRHDAVQGKQRSQQALRKMLKRRLSRQYTATIATFRDAIGYARESSQLMLMTDADFTTPCPLDGVTPTQVSRADFEAQKGSVKPITAHFKADNEVLATIIDECTTHDGFYHLAVEHSISKHLDIILSLSPNGGFFTLIDRNGTLHTLPAPLYILPDGRLYAVGRGEYFAPQVIVGHLDDGVVTIEGSLAVPRPTEDIRCTERGLYLVAADDKEYLFIE